MIDLATVSANAARLRERISDAGGDADRIGLVAVTKGHPASVARTAACAGLFDLGENYVQELADKAESLADEVPPVRWHLVGRLQRNKVRRAAPYVSLWQSIDRLSLAHEVAERAPAAPVLVQVNTSGEVHKGGCRPELAAAVVEACRDLGLEVRGLMTVGPERDPATTRAAFRSLARLADQLDLPERSMGMSGDLEAAVAEGSTMVRIGTALFGPRPVRAGVRD